MISGRCLCGEIAYQIAGKIPEGVSGCHCTQCRKVTGHFSAAAPVAWSDLTIEGTPRWYDSTPGQARRGFCGTCGSYLFWEQFDGIVYVSAGSMDAPTGLWLQRHIFYAEKGDYYCCDDGAPRFVGWETGPEVDP
jgi:hypothetical protein